MILKLLLMGSPYRCYIHNAGKNSIMRSWSWSCQIIYTYPCQEWASQEPASQKQASKERASQEGASQEPVVNQQHDIIEVYLCRQGFWRTLMQWFGTTSRTRPLVRRWAPLKWGHPSDEATRQTWPPRLLMNSGPPLFLALVKRANDNEVCQNVGQ